LNDRPQELAPDGSVLAAEAEIDDLSAHSVLVVGELLR
jgi:hypothetical protein